MQQIRADEISQIIRKRIEEFDKEVQVAETGSVLSVGDGVATIVPVGVNGTDRVWRKGQSLDFQNTAPYLALRSAKPIAAAIADGIAGAGKDPMLKRDMGKDATPQQMAFWMTDIANIVLLDFIFSQQDRIGNIAAGMEADLVVIDLASTPAIEQATRRADDLWRLLRDPVKGPEADGRSGFQRAWERGERILFMPDQHLGRNTIHFGAQLGWFYALTLIPRAADVFREIAFYDLHRPRDGTWIIGRLAIGDSTLRRHGYPNASVTLLPRPRRRLSVPAPARPGAAPAPDP